jgi:hypothetical protein
MKKPHDPTDLLLSPVALAIDERLEEFATLNPAQLSSRIVLETNTQPRNPTEAAEALVASLTYLLDTHGWEVSWDDGRGIRLHHDDHDVVLGVSDNLVHYVAKA